MALSGDQLATILVGLAGGGVGVKLLDWWQTRGRERRAEPADLTKAYAAFAEAVTAQAEGLIEDLRKELKFVRGQCEELHTKVAEADRHRETCEAELRDVRQRVFVIENRPSVPVGS